MSSEAPWLVVGLGNPGARYAETRHNVGFMVAEAFVGEHDAYASWRERFHGRVATCRVGSTRCVVLQPQTFMNVSGKSVVAAAGFHKVPISQIVVVHDELDFDFGRVAVKVGGGHGGHNGIRDIAGKLGTREFLRVRLGIGRPPAGRGDVSSWVLSGFDASDAAELPDSIRQARQAVTAVVAEGPDKAMNTFNTTTS